MDVITDSEQRHGASFLHQLLRRKDLYTLAASLEQNNALHRTLTLPALVAMGVGAVVGAGVFVITGQAAALYAGPALSLSFLLCIFPCAFTGLCYAELAAMVPVAGSAYTHTSLALGEVASFLVAVCLTLENLVAGSAVAVSWSASVNSLLGEFGTGFPASIARTPVEVSGTDFVLTGAVINLPAVAICLLCTAFLCKGIRESAKANNIFVIVKLSVLACFVLYGAFYACGHWSTFSGNLSPFIPPNEGSFGRYGVSGVLRGAGVVFFANVGFDTVCATAQECRRPQHDLPRCLIYTLFACTGIYVAVTVMLTGMMNFRLLDVDDPVLVALAHVDAPLLFRLLVDIGAVAGLTSVCLMCFLSMPRLLLTLAKDGLVPRCLARVHPTTRTPVVATVSSGVLGACIAGFFPLDMLGNIISFGTLVAFTCVCVSTWRMRRMYPDFPRPFRTPFCPYTPILGVCFNVFQLLMLPWATWRNYLLVLSISMLWYLIYGRTHSSLCVLSSSFPGAGAPSNDFSTGDSVPIEQGIVAEMKMSAVDIVSGGFVVVLEDPRAREYDLEDLPAVDNKFLE